MKLLGLLSAANQKGSFHRREPVRRWLRRLLLVLSVVIIAPSLYEGRADGQSHVARGGIVGIQNQTEHDLFFSLICQCGCPRETLGTCTCDYASARRAELRDSLEAGMSVTAIQQAYAKRFGTQALAVPPNAGAGALIWAFPLVAFIVAAFLIVRVLRRWTGRGVKQNAAAREAKAAAVAAAGTSAAASKSSDDYDRRLDDELRELDRE